LKNKQSVFIAASEADRAALLASCDREPAANLFMRADIMRFGFDRPFQRVWKQLDRDGACIGLALRYFDNYLYYTDHIGPHIAEAGVWFNAQNARLISAKPALLDRIAPEIEGDSKRHDMLLCVLQTGEKLLPAPEGLIEARVSDAQEIAEAYQYIPEFRGLYLGGAAALAETIANRITSGEGRHWFLRRAGQIVCHASTTAETEQSGVIGGVFTLAAWRGRGLASGVVSAACSSLLTRGKTPALFFDNPEAGRLYYKLGFTQTGAWGNLEPRLVQEV
jgi:predicted GNAT family acetyltransferase